MSDNSQKQELADDMQDIAELYAASQTEQSPADRDDAILTAAHESAKSRSKSANQRRGVYHPPLAIAATLVLTIGLVVLIKQDIEQSSLPPSIDESLSESFSPTIQSSQEETTQALLDQETKLQTSDSAPIPAKASTPPTIEKIQAANSEPLAGVASDKVLGESMPQPQQASSEALKEAVQRVETRRQDALQRARATNTDMKREALAQKRLFAKKMRDKPLAQAAAPPTTTPQRVIPEVDTMPPAIRTAQRIGHQKGEVRVVTDQLEVWYDENHRWISPEQYFALELKRLDGPTYGTVVTYPAYESVTEWETLIDRLADGRECPMVFFHERWRRLPDVLDLDERLRNYGGCADVFNE